MPHRQINDFQAFGAHAPRGALARIIRAARRAPEGWAGRRAAYLLRALGIRALRGKPADVEALGAQGLRVTVERWAEPEEAPATGDRLALHLVGHDQPGIVAEVSALLAEHGVNVELLTTQVSEAPIAGGTLFEADAVIGVPANADVTALRNALEALAGELMVDLDLHDSE